MKGGHYPKRLVGPWEPETGSKRQQRLLKHIFGPRVYGRRFMNKRRNLNTKYMERVALDAPAKEGT